MVHTAKYYKELTEECLNSIISRNKCSTIDLALSRVDSKVEGISSKHLFFMNKHHLSISVNFIELLNKSDITENDLHEINEMLRKYVYLLLGSNDIHSIILTRLDYRLDFNIDKDDRDLLFTLHYRTLKEKGHEKRSKEHFTSTYFQSKSVKALTYDKEQERTDNQIIVMPYEKNVLRFEVALMNKHLSHHLYRNSITKSLDYYFNEALAKKYFIKMYAAFLTKSDYHSFNKAISIVRASSMKDINKTLCIDFLTLTSKHSLTAAKNQKNYSSYMYKKIMKLLDSINVSAITMPNNWNKDFIENPLKDILS